MKLLLLLALLAAGCGLIVQSKYIPPTPADPAKYGNWECSKLADQNAQLDDLLKVAGASYETIAMMTGMGMTSDFPLTKEISRLKGEQIAVKDALSKCPVP